MASWPQLSRLTSHVSLLGALDLLVKAASAIDVPRRMNSSVSSSALKRTSDSKFQWVVLFVSQLQRPCGKTKSSESNGEILMRSHECSSFETARTHARSQVTIKGFRCSMCPVGAVVFNLGYGTTFAPGRHLGVCPRRQSYSRDCSKQSFQITLLNEAQRCCV